MYVLLVSRHFQKRTRSPGKINRWQREPSCDLLLRSCTTVSLEKAVETLYKRKQQGDDCFG